MLLFKLVADVMQETSMRLYALTELHDPEALELFITVSSNSMTLMGDAAAAGSASRPAPDAHLVA
jgi:hypothetical protein